MDMKEIEKEKPLGHNLHDLFTNVTSLVQGKLQGTNNLLELIEKINLRNNVKLLQAFRVLCHPPDECTISIIVDMEFPKPDDKL